MLSEQRVIERLKKEKILQNYQARETLNEILSVRPEERSKKQVDTLVSLLVDYPCFQFVAEESVDALVALTKEIYMECLLPDKVVMRQGEEASAAYVMIQGSCSVHVEITYKVLDRVKTKTVSFHKVDLADRAR